jgi:hypothetical protein
MEELALLYLRKALEEALKAGGNAFLDDLFGKMSERQIDALIKILQVVKSRKQTAQSKTG